MATVKKGLSYLLGTAGEKENHILPINAMQYSLSRGQLYTGGRDGLVKVWSAQRHAPASSFNFSMGDDDYHDDLQDISEALLKLETAISTLKVPYTSPATAFDMAHTSNYNIHFDWINDLKLVNDDNHIVSASADLSLKLISLADSLVQKFQNLHTDYIKKVSSNPLRLSLVSGGLDGQVIVWDLKTLKSTLQFTNYSSTSGLPNSIYALSNDDGFLISTGGPNNTINLFDTRVSPTTNANLVHKLIGHQDNVRCLLMNSKYILSGSLDTTIKLWDLRNFSIYKNIEVHDNAVWTLSTSASSNPGSSSHALSDFKEIYSGDKAGHIIKTDISCLSTNSSYEDRGSIIGTTFSASEQAYLDENAGLCTLVAKVESPVVSLCVEGNASVFVSTYSSLNRYHIPDTLQLAKYQYLREGVEYLDAIESRQNLDGQGDYDSPADQSDLNSDLHDIFSHLSVDSGPLQTLSMPGITISARDAPHSLSAPELREEFVSMFLNVNGGPSTQFVNVYKDEPVKADELEEELRYVDQTPVELLLNPVPPDQIITTPFNKEPFAEFHLSPKSVLFKRMFNNKRHLITLTINGDIGIWDLFTCKQKQNFPYIGGRFPLSDDDLKGRMRELDAIFTQLQTNETLLNWCEVEIRSGKLLVTLAEAFFSNLEIYCDELMAEYPFIKIQTSSKTPLPIPADKRFWLARIFLDSILHPYIEYEWQADRKLRELLRLLRAAENNEVEDTSKIKRLFPRRSSRLSLSQMSVNSNVTDPELTTEADSLEESDLSTSSDKDTIMKMLIMNKRFYKDKYQTQGSKKLVGSLLKVHPSDTGEVVTEVEYKPLIPDEELPKDLLIIIFESSPHLGNYRDLCSFHRETLKSLYNVDLVLKTFLRQLRTTLPKWLGLPLLYNKVTERDVLKVAFHLMEADYSLMPPDKKIGGKSQKKIKKLPPLESSIRLTSHSMLRVSKILQYLTEKFESRPPEVKQKVPATEWLMLECKGHVLNNSMTLQTIKTTIWKSSAEMELRYHRKFD